MKQKIMYKEYLCCPYCTDHNGAHEKKVPKSVGKYRIQIIYNNMLVMKCSRCGHVSRLSINSGLLMWEKIAKKKQEEIKQAQYDKYKGGNKELQWQKISKF